MVAKGRIGRSVHVCVCVCVFRSLCKGQRLELGERKCMCGRKTKGSETREERRIAA